ncbi:hypothetical protein Cgig2_023851 [Carnegiea gigantea]|uniref:Uncharacterized protein n=1 Tax=Carnegiea gigantea TaxID=171969 RepID=A0A9Q1K8V3_9CARY|nr:hypothetical protein Cgig2_023851 [Carnegiea gigantea]
MKKSEKQRRLDLKQPKGYIVQHFVDEKLEFDASYVYQDVNHAIQHVHKSGLAHWKIISDPQRYLVKNGQLFHFLKMLREHGKKLFLLTNSPYYFVDGGMSFLLECVSFLLSSLFPGWRSNVENWSSTFSGADHPTLGFRDLGNGPLYPTISIKLCFLLLWAAMQLLSIVLERGKGGVRRTAMGFDVMLVGDLDLVSSAISEPGHGKIPWALETVGENFLMWSLRKPISQTSICQSVHSVLTRFLVLWHRCYDIDKETMAFSKVDAFLPNKVYYYGCLKSFLQITKWKGPEVIYFGDHLFSDLRGPSKAGWRTAAIIYELENEIRIQNDDNYRFEQAKFHIIEELLGRLHATVSQKSEACNSLLEELNEERQKARWTMKTMFNKSFGATFLTDAGRESSFAYHIHQYADVYTSKPENFLLYPSEAWLHVPFDIKIMPHHVKVCSSFHMF